MNKKSFSVAALGALVQYYDYHLFGFLAASISKYFFPASDNTTTLLNTYLIMAVAIIAKPIGALILGKIGDTYGRSRTFAISLLGTALASLIISLTPDYHVIGLFSTLILLSARMLSCALISSGTDGIRIYIYEHISPARRCFGIGLTTIFIQLGSFIAALSAWIFTMDFMPSYSWRGAFMLGSFLGLGVLVLKYKLKVTDYILLKEETNFEYFQNLSMLQIIKNHELLFLSSCLLTGGIGSIHQFFIIFFGTYNFEILHNINQSLMRIYLATGIFIYMIGSLVAGYIADKFNWHKVAKIGSFCLLLLSLGHIYFLGRGKFSVTLFMLTNIAMPFLTMPTAAILKESIPRIIRYRLFSLAHATGSIFLSAPTAYIATLLYHKSQIAWLPMGYFIVIIMIIFGALSLRTKAAL